MRLALCAGLALGPALGCLPDSPQRTAAESAGQTEPREQPKPASADCSSDQDQTPSPSCRAEASQPSATAQPVKDGGIGTVEDWVAAYAGSGTPETKPPPQLGVLGSLNVSQGLIAFEQDSQIWTVSVPDGRLRQLTSTGRSSGPIRWSADGSRLAYLSLQADGICQIHVRPAGADGSPPAAVGRPLPSEACSGGTAVFYAFSPAGGSLLYLAPARPGSWAMDGLSAVLSYDLTTGRERVILREARVREPSLSPDGQSLLYLSDSPAAIYRLSLGSGRARQLPTVRHSAFHSPLSLPSERLLFAARLDSASERPDLVLYSTGPDGSGWQPLAPEPAVVGDHIRLYPSADGRRLALGWRLRGSGTSEDVPREEVTVMGTDGAAVRMLTSAFPRPFFNAQDPSWAPDSRHLVFQLKHCPYPGCRHGKSRLVIADTDAPEPKLIFAALGSSPAWRPSPGS